MTTALTLWLCFAALSGALLAGGRRDFPSLHTALDTAMALLPAVLAWLLWDVGRRINQRLPKLLAITFALTATLNLIHMLVAVEWFGALAFISQRAATWRPATWPPATYLLPIGTLFAILRAGQRGRNELLFALVMALVAGLLLIFFEYLPKYTSPWALGITRPFLGVVPLMWVAVAGLCLQRLENDRLMQPILLMAVTLVVANLAMLYSMAPHDPEAMIAHLGRVCGYLVLLLALLRTATMDMQARARAEASLAQANAQLAQVNAQLESRVQDRMAELAQASNSLRESETRLRAFVSATSDVVYRMSPDWNEMRQLVGQDFIADTADPSRNWLAKYIHPTDQALVTETIHKAIEARSKFELEHRVLRPDGTLAWTFSRAIPLMNERGEIAEWFGAASDVTDRKVAESRLNAQLERLTLLRQLTRAISERQDPRSIYQVVLRSLEEELPADFACVCIYRAVDQALTVVGIGVKSSELAVTLAMPENARIAIDQNGLSRCVRGQLVYEPDVRQSPFPFPQRLARGGLRAIVASPLQVESEVFGVLIVARRAPDSFSSGECEFLRQLSDHVGLGSHHAELYMSLQQAYDDLRRTRESIMQQERLRALGQMASGIAHDINNALSPAALYAQSLLEHDRSLSVQAREYLTVIQRAVEGVGNTVGRLRMFYRPREAELTLKLVDLNTLLQQVVELTRARWSAIPQERGIVIDLQSDFAPQLPLIMGAENEIRDAFTNLVLNAVDAMLEGGTLTIRTSVEAGREAGHVPSVTVEVGDTGIGMTKEVQRRCLEPFFTTKGERGTGLGLAMVYGMVQRHSAEFEIDSTEGVGTKVRLTFAVATATRAPQIATVTGTPPPLRILLVDDDPLILKSLGDVLESEGHTVTTADGGQKGIDEFFTARGRGEPFDVVITDLGMPKVDGRTVAAAVKPAAPSTTVLLLTGWGQRLQDEADLPEHVDRVLAKPPRLSEVRSALAELVKQTES